MKSKAIFLDRDGTINVEKNYLYRIEDFEFLPGVTDALRKLQEAGYLLIVITNQSGIARGYYTEDDFRMLNDWMKAYLQNEGIVIDAAYYCPHLPDAPVLTYRQNCTCRKPKPGMFEKAVKEFNIDLSQSWAIGDKLRDCAICENTECHGILIGNNEKPDIIEDVRKGKKKNIEYAEDLLKSAEIILWRENV